MAVTFTGDGGDNFFPGTLAADTAYGLGGNDELHGADLGDVLDGGDGNDILVGNESLG